jgi:histone-lysine N-methyltransferase SETMAR
MREIYAEVCIFYGTCQGILGLDLNMRRVSAKFVPRVVTIEQKEHRLCVTSNLLQEAEADQNFMEGIITRDETWVYGYDPETKRPSSY